MSKKQEKKPDIKIFILTQEEINKLSPISLNKINSKEWVKGYTLNEFSYDKDKLPCIILLLPDDITPSGHYIALSQSEDEKTLYYFDSYGYNPLKLWEEHPQMIGEKQDIDKWGEFLKQYDKIIYQDKKLQDDKSYICGYYCLSYIYEFKSRRDYTPETFTQIIEYTKKKFNLDNYDNALLLYYLSCIVGFDEDAFIEFLGNIAEIKNEENKDEIEIKEEIK